MTSTDDTTNNMNTEKFREHFRNNIIPKNYSGKVHATFNFSCLLGALLIFTIQLKEVSLLQFLILPAFIILGNLAVYIIHRLPLHTPTAATKEAYKIHSKWHHVFFTDQCVTYQGPRDFFILFFPTWFAALFTFIYLPSIYLVTSLFFSKNIALLAGIGSTLYFLGYEFVHYASHLPPEHWLLKIGHLRRMREYHRHHHNPRLMHKYNFNIVFPLFDYVFKTAYNPAAGKREK